MRSGSSAWISTVPVAGGTVPVYHEDVRVWEVKDRASGEHVGLWYLDPYARPGKSSGAWATTYRSHETFDGKQTVLSSNNSNFIKGAPGEPVAPAHWIWNEGGTTPPFHFTTTPCIGSGCSARKSTCT